MLPTRSAGSSLWGIPSTNVVPMVYESLGSIILVVIAAILILAWLPGRTMRGMKRASEHRQDRLSTSLHMVKGQDGMRFGDTGSRTAKGLVMQQEQQDKASKEAARVRHIRQMRREAIRRRRTLVITLLLVTVLVLGFSFPVEYSPWFAAIPLALTLAVLAAGARASAQARAWEENLARRRAHNRRRQRANLMSKTGYQPDRIQAEVYPSRTEPSEPGEDATDVLDKQEINQTIAQAQKEKREALDARQHTGKVPASVAPVDHGQKTSPGTAPGLGGQDGEANGSSSPKLQTIGSEGHDNQSGSHLPTGHGSSQETRRGGSPQSSLNEVVDPAKTVASSPSAPHGQGGKATAAIVNSKDDLTHELKQISPSPVLDAFEMASSQDLISFSLGSPRNRAVQEDNGPQSREIKSTRQVSKAEPVKAEAKAGSQKSGLNRGIEKETAPEEDSERPGAFHQREMEAKVEVPRQSSDSLAIGVEAILARRHPSDLD